MDCPHCGFHLDASALDCPRCGIVIAKFLRAQEASHQPSDDSPDLVAHALDGPAIDRQATRTERLARAVAIPAALAFAGIAVKEDPGLVRVFFSMWVHESGHAVASWLCGYPALPGPWATVGSATQSPTFAALLFGAVAFGGYRARQLQRWFWVACAAGALVVIAYCSLALGEVKARQLITFGGDAGCFVLGTLLMLTVYAREDHPIRENQIRWALVAIGALAFVDAYHVWSGPIDKLPFGEAENGLSDPSVLSEMYGWNVLILIHRYLALAYSCLAVLATVYVSALLLDVPSSRVTASRAESPEVRLT